ncbi:MAG: putative PEP-CTERM system histidine kinase [Alteromonadaceae bacterium]|jgi:putative PEP-CTERM system histidine kinase
MDSIGLTGFVLASVAYIVFALLIFAARNSSTLARWVLISAFVTALANGAAALQIEMGYSLQWVMVADGFKIACWSIWVLLCNAKHRSFKALLNNHYIKQYLAVWSVLMVVCWLLTYLFSYSYEYLFLLFIILNLWSLVLLEQLYRSASSQIRWAIWPLVIAIASISLFDFVLYAQATMVDGIDFDFWFSRGIISLAVVPLLLISTRRIKNGSVRIFVSRHVVFYSSMLMIAGVYLLVMALAGYVINYFGGEWGKLVSVGFLILGGIVLVVLLMTETLRRQLKVFIAKNFFANKYEYREEWLNLIGKIETGSAENHYQMATQIMMSKVEANYGAIIKQVSNTQFDVKYTQGLEFEDIFTPQLIHLCHFCKREGWIVDLAEYMQTPSIYPDLSLNLLQCEEKNISVVVPIFIGKAFYGLFVLAVDRKIKKLNWEDRDLLFAISKQLGNFVSLHEANDKIAESKQFDAFNRMSAFLVHDLKNVQAQLALIITNAEKHRDNPEFIDDVFETIDSATSRLEKVLTQLRNKQVAQSKNKKIELSTLIEKVVAQCNVRTPTVAFSAIQTCTLNIDDETLFSILNHLIQNAQEATTSAGWVKVTMQVKAPDVEISIVDNGSGMSSQFIEKRLFKPFDTTKGNAGMGIGVFEAKQFIESNAGSIKVSSEEGKGTTFVVNLPIHS